MFKILKTYSAKVRTEGSLACMQKNVGTSRATWYATLFYARFQGFIKHSTLTTFINSVIQPAVQSLC